MYNLFRNYLFPRKWLGFTGLKINWVKNVKASIHILGCKCIIIQQGNRLFKSQEIEFPVTKNDRLVEL